MALAKVANTDVLHLAGLDQLLHLAPRVNEVPIRVDLLQVWVGAAWPVNKVQVDVIGTQVLERGVNALSDALVPWVVELGGEPDLAAGDAGGLDSDTDFGLVLVGEGCVDVAWGVLGMGGIGGLRGNMEGERRTVTAAESALNGLLNFSGLGLPRPEADGWDLGTSVQSERLAAAGVSAFQSEGVVGTHTRCA